MSVDESLTGAPAFIVGLTQRLGSEIGATHWFPVSQQAVNEFGRVTDDDDPMHSDPAWAKEGPFGVTVAHGMYTLSLLPRFARELGFPILSGEGAMAINYGFDRVRLIDPVPVGSDIRCRMTLRKVEPKGGQRWLVYTTCTIECRGSTRPCAIADWICLYAYT